MRALGKLLTIGVILAGSSSLASHASAQASQWDHNGSVMRLEVKGEKTRFIYEDPRGALAAAKVKRGTVLFDGKEKKDGRLEGYAKLFRKGCDPVDYYVEGAYDKEKGEILLQGQAPLYSGDGCKITGYTDEGSASSLQFTRTGPAPNLYADREEPAARSAGDSRDYLPPRSLSSAEDAPVDAEPPRRRTREAEANIDRDPPRRQRAREADVERDPAYTGRSYVERDPAYSERDYAYQPEYRRYRRLYQSDDEYVPSWREPYDEYEYDDDDEYDEPAYHPYQPGWRRYYD
ncbi:MAG: hypothetical protein ACFCUR_19130 [Rhodomicrobiaceae bacterium]